MLHAGRYLALSELRERIGRLECRGRSRKALPFGVRAVDRHLRCGRPIAIRRTRATRRRGQAARHGTSCSPALRRGGTLCARAAYHITLPVSGKNHARSYSRLHPRLPIRAARLLLHTRNPFRRRFSSTRFRKASAAWSIASAPLSCVLSRNPIAATGARASVPAC